MSFSRLPMWVALLGLPIAVAACESIGAGSIEAGRLKYNEAVHDTGGEQLLTNIVRIHKNELPFSVLVTEIIAGVTPQASVGASVAGLGIGSKGGAFRQGSITSGMLSIGASYAEGTSVQYQPIGGAALVTQLTTPVSVSLIGDLLDSGWPLLTVLEMTAALLTPAGESFGVVLNNMSEMYYRTWLDVVPAVAAQPDTADTKPGGKVGKSSGSAAAGGNRGESSPSLASALLAFSKAGEKVADAVKPAKGPDNLILFFRSPDIGDKGWDRAQTLWSNLVNVYAGTNAVAQDRTTITLRTKPLPAESKANEAGWRGRLLGMLSAYAILKSAEVSDTTPTEVIDVLPAAFYDRIKGEPWNSGQEFYTFLTTDICSPEYGGKSFDRGLRCQDLINPDGDPDPEVKDNTGTAAVERPPSYFDHNGRINDTVDQQICSQLSRGDVTERSNAIPDACRNIFEKSGMAFPGPAGGYSPRSKTTYVVDCNKWGLGDGDCTRAQENLNRRRRLILVLHSPAMPAEYFRMVYRDAEYYYIADDDYISQKNFALLALIEDVQTVAPSGPISTTIPVGAP